MPVYELLGGAVRERIPVYWSHCGLFRARYSHLFGKVIDALPVRTLDDLRAAGREVAQRGFKALKTNVLIFDKEWRETARTGDGQGTRISGTEHRCRCDQSDCRPARSAP